MSVCDSSNADNDNVRTISLAAGDKIEATPPIFYSQLGLD